MTEYWDLLGENREPLGLLHQRGKSMPVGARHLCVEVITPRIFSDTYLLILNEEPKITLQSTETVDYAWLTPEEMLERCRSGIVIGHLAQRFARYAVMLRELLQKEGTQ